MEGRQMTESRSPLVTWRELLVFFLLAGPVLWLVGQVDATVFQFAESRARNEHDWTRMFRMMGFLPFWLIVAAAVWRLDQKPGRALLLVGSVVGAGVTGEILKLAIHRSRPQSPSGDQPFAVWHGFSLDTSGLATPSSHAIVAFGAAWMLCRLFPRGAVIWLGLAAGCGLVRVRAGAHSVSDVYLAAVVSFGVVLLLWRWQAQRRPAK
jgi:membrane-associated phospholipid phosphatase